MDMPTTKQNPIAERLTRVETQLGELISTVNWIKKELQGNGKAGLIATVAANKTAIDTTNKDLCEHLEDHKMASKEKRDSGASIKLLVYANIGSIVTGLIIAIVLAVIGLK